MECPQEVMEGIIEGGRRFNEDDDEVKRMYYTRDASKKVSFNSNFDLYQAPSANWRDTLTCLMAPETLPPDELPLACRTTSVVCRGFHQDQWVMYSHTPARLSTWRSITDFLKECLPVYEKYGYDIQLQNEIKLSASNN
ncbi:probable 2-oxoacid dependent dioxygenase [Asparagus officinalis]|nr:probable 2-oxoacid dependent dioxygenase [Asparagus officinalis]